MATQVALAAGPPWWLDVVTPGAWWLRPLPAARPAPAGFHDPRARGPAGTYASAGGTGRLPVSVRLLRLATLRPSGWHRVLIFEGTWVVAALVALAERATAWLPVIVPVAVLVLLKLVDVVVTRARSR